MWLRRARSNLAIARMDKREDVMLEDLSQIPPKL
jgi:hypothetical protein